MLALASCKQIAEAIPLLVQGEGGTQHKFDHFAFIGRAEREHHRPSFNTSGDASYVTQYSSGWNRGLLQDA